ncbi:hypothetical protein FI667_g8725, partial [Globisporangium splendens]
MYEEYPTVCLIGGGIGVTPILDDMVTKLSNDEPMRQRVYFIFTFRELSLLEELHPLLMRIRELDPQEKSFTFHFSLTRTPSEELLAKVVDHKRLSGHHHAVATKHNDDAKYLKMPPQPFAQPLQSPLRRSATYIIIYVFVVIIVSVLTYGGGKIKRVKHAHLWPLQAFVEILILFLGALIVYSLVLIERVVQQKMGVKNANKGFFDVYKSEATIATHHFENNVKTFADLIKTHQVTVGHRPDVDILIRLVRQGHQSFVANNQAMCGSGTIGVFMSGPKSLKHVIQLTVASTSPSEFDIHEEEFRL